MSKPMQFVTTSALRHLRTWRAANRGRPLAFFACVIILFLETGALAAAEYPALESDALYERQVAQVLCEKPDAKDLTKLQSWLWAVCSSEIRCRKYADAELPARALLALNGQYFLHHSNLSVILGKQGKYEEALREAEIAKFLNPDDTMHADAVACSWLYALGRKEEAIHRFDTIAVPAEPYGCGVYWACKAALYCEVGDIAVIEASIKQSLQAFPNERKFFERDIIFDKYRDSEWFVGLIGKTLK